MNAGETLGLTARDDTPRSKPVTIDRNAYAASAVNLMEKHIITSLLVINSDGEPIGLIRWIDLSLAGVI